VAKTVSPQYFIEQYKRVIDPWRYESSAYERRKYQATLDALPRARYRNALELACSVGVFTNMLAPRCDSLVAVDVSPEALQRAGNNCAHRRNVRFEQHTLPQDYPGGEFDLTTVCEMGYYFSIPDLAALRERVREHSADGAHVILVHWTPPVAGHASTAEEVHDVFRACPDFVHVRGFTRETYRLDVFERRSRSARA
jgi:SAM-dependent methyltransferase